MGMVPDLSTGFRAKLEDTWSLCNLVEPLEHPYIGSEGCRIQWAPSMGFKAKLKTPYSLK